MEESSEKADPFDYGSARKVAIVDPHYDPWEGIQPAPPDPLFAVGKRAAELGREHPDAILFNLGLGVYRRQGPVTLDCVIQAEQALASELDGHTNREYRGQKGHPEFLEKALEVVFGTDHPLLKPPHRERIVALATPGGTGANFMVAELIRILEKETNQKAVLFSGIPGWPNHANIFGKKHGIEIQEFDHLDRDDSPSLLNLSTVIEERKQKGEYIPLILAQDRCHNSTGINYTPSQIEDFVALAKYYNAIVFVDSAYQGFGDGFEQDSLLIRRLAEKGVMVMVSYSFSKNLSEYDDRDGFMFMVNHNPATARILQTRSEIDVARPTWTCPPGGPQRLTARILGNPDLREGFAKEVGKIRRDLLKRRDLLADGLPDKQRKLQERLRSGRGLFAMLGLTEDQVEKLTIPRRDEKIGKDVMVVMPKSSRINIGTAAEIQGESTETAINILARRLKAVLDSSTM